MRSDNLIWSGDLRLTKMTILCLWLYLREKNLQTWLDCLLLFIQSSTNNDGIIIHIRTANDTLYNYNESDERNNNKSIHVKVRSQSPFAQRNHASTLLPIRPNTPRTISGLSWRQVRRMAALIENAIRSRC